MSETKIPHDADANEVSSRLIAGLKSCKSVVENYRAMLTGGEAEGAPEPSAPQATDTAENP